MEMQLKRDKLWTVTRDPGPNPEAEDVDRAMGTIGLAVKSHVYSILQGQTTAEGVRRTNKLPKGVRRINQLLKGVRDSKKTCHCSPVKYITMFLVWMAFAMNAIVYIMCKLGLPAEYKWFFALSYSRLFGPAVDAGLDEQKSSLFAQLRKRISNAQHLSNRNGLRILEVGAGPGLNIKYFGQGTSYIAVDINEYFADYLKKNLAAFPSVKLEQHLVCPAENMSDIADNSIDVVVSTYTLCSVRDPRKAVKEIFRVLIPGGHFLYLEHVGYRPGSWGRAIQSFVQPFWGAAADGCRLSSDISAIIRKLGFSSIHEGAIYINCMPYLIRPHVVGIVVK